MKISFNWLRQYINLDLSAEETAVILTGIGLEVESLYRFESVPGSLAGLVVGHVLSCRKHPQADKLTLTQVDTGGPEPLPIVCGAPNVAEGQKVIVAPVGTTLYGFPEPMTIRKAKIRGEVSEGMICAEDEIGIGKDHSGIMILDPDVPPGTSVADLFEVESDFIFEIGLTPNRIDSASHYGVARELMAVLGNERSFNLNKPPLTIPARNGDLEISVEIADKEGCIRYSGITLDGIIVKESPAWLKNRLLSIGMTPINNVVDITNFVLHETGQPLHAFDADQIKGRKVIVRTLPDQTPFVTLDKQERKLSSQDLMICNVDQGMCIAGVFGGLHSGVTENTTCIFLESACFNPVCIRKTSKRHQLYTDSSFRFERGTDPNATIHALRRASGLICEIAGGRIASEIVDVYPQPVPPYPVYLTWNNLDRLVGLSIDRDEVRRILRSIDIEIERETDQGLHLAVATYRVDVRREADVIEEILRIYGYNNIGTGEQLISTLAYADEPDADQMENMISEQLTAQGFNEIMANSLTRSAYYDELQSFPPTGRVNLLNPLSHDLNSLRQTLLFGGLESIRTNTSFKNHDLKLYEFGYTYFLKPDGNRLLADGYQETRFLALWITGKTNPESWSEKQKETGFFGLKSYISLVLQRLGINLPDITTEEHSDDLLSIGLIFKLIKHRIGVIGQVQPDILATMEIDQPVWYAELHWDLLIKLSNLKVTFQELPRYPWVRRDLALVVDKSIRFEQVKSLAFMVERKLLKDVNLFDIYTSDKLGEGKKSLAVSFILQDENKTLTDKQIDQVMSALVSAYEKKLGAVLR